LQHLNVRSISADLKTLVDTNQELNQHVSMVEDIKYKGLIEILDDANSHYDEFD